MIVVLFSAIFLIESLMFCSVSVSRAEVGSSSIKIAGFLRNARAIAIL